MTMLQMLIPKELRDPAALEKTQKDFAQTVDAAQNETDAAKRLLAALEVKRALKKEVDRLDGRLEQRADNVGWSISGSSGGLSLATGITWACITGSGVGILLAFAGVIASLIAAPVAGYFGYKFLRRAFEGHDNALEGLKEKAAGIVDKTLTANTAEITVSPLLGKIYQNFPKVREHFNVAFAQKTGMPPGHFANAPEAQKPAPAPKTGLEPELGL